MPLTARLPRIDRIAKPRLYGGEDRLIYRGTAGPLESNSFSKAYITMEIHSTNHGEEPFSQVLFLIQRGRRRNLQYSARFEPTYNEDGSLDFNLIHKPVSFLWGGGWPPLGYGERVNRREERRFRKLMETIHSDPKTGELFRQCVSEKGLSQDDFTAPMWEFLDVPEIDLTKVPYPDYDSYMLQIS